MFYRAMLLAADMAPIDALCDALAARGLAPAPLFVTRLKDPDAATFMIDALARLDPAVIVCTTAFAAGGNPGEPTPLDGPDVPVLQAIIASTKRAAWCDSPRGLGAADLAMNIVLPELDGRILAGAISFKHPLPADAGLAFTALVNQPEPDRIAMVADRVAALARLRTTPRAERRIAILMPDYPGAPGRTGYAVGLDVPASVLALLADLTAAGYAVDAAPPTARALIDALSATDADATLPLDTYARLLGELPAEIAERIDAAWGAPASDPDVSDGAFRFRAQSFGNIIVALPPDRGRAARPPRRLSRSGLAAAPCAARLRALAAACPQGRRHRPHGGTRHARMAARQGGGADRDLLSRRPCSGRCRCSIRSSSAIRARPRRPSAGSPASPSATCRRRWSKPSSSGAARDLERLVDEYAQADGLDPRRRQRLAALIVETARRNGLAGEAGIDRATGPDEALRRIDAWLCDLKDLADQGRPAHFWPRAWLSGTPSPEQRSAPPPPARGR